MTICKQSDQVTLNSGWQRVIFDWLRATDYAPSSLWEPAIVTLPSAGVYLVAYNIHLGHLDASSIYSVSVLVDDEEQYLTND